MASLNARIALLERMLSNTSAVARLDDGGAKVRAQLEALRAQRSESEKAPEPEASGTAAAPTKPNDDDRTKPTMSTEERVKQQIIVGEMTKHDKPDLQSVLKTRFRGLLSNREITRLIREAGTDPLASWAETQMMIMQERELERTRELERLNRLTTPR